MRRLAFIVTFLVGTVGTLQWLSQGFSSSWEPQLRAYLAATAGKALQADVSIDSIVPSFFHRIRLVNVRVREPDQTPLFQAGEIDLTISFIDLPRALLHGKGVEAIGLVLVKNPWLRLSPQALAKRMSHRHSATSLPPWFTLAWEGGTIQWLDRDALHHSLTLYQTHGVFRIRGPQTTFAMVGQVDQAKSIRFQFSSLGHRWNAQVRLTEGYCAKVLELLRAFSKKDLLPRAWTARGTFDMEAHASGQQWPKHGEDWLHFIDDIHLSFLRSPTAEKMEKPSLALTGIFLYKKGNVTSPSFTLEGPWFGGTGHLDLELRQLRFHPDIIVKAVVSSGWLGSSLSPSRRWIFQNAQANAHYVNDHWEFGQNSVHILDGLLSMKGYAGPDMSDVSVTAEDISLEALSQNHGLKAFKGRINASCGMKGAVGDRQLSGSWWLSGLQWNSSPIENAGGDLEITSDHFHAQAKSDNSHFRFSTEGTVTEKSLSIDQLALNLPDGATLAVDGDYDRQTQQLHGSFEANQIDFPADIPLLALTHVPLKGRFDIKGRLGGTRDHVTGKGLVQSPQITLASQTFGKGTLRFLWDDSHLEIPSFHIDPGIDGHYTEGEGVITARNIAWGKWPVNQGTLRLSAGPQSLTIDQCFVQTPNGSFDFAGKARWPKAHPTSVELAGHGRLLSADSKAWDIPYGVTGKMEREESGWNGNAHLTAHHPLVQGLPVEPLEAALEWSPRFIRWTEAHWGKQWISQGTFHWENGPGEWSARLEARQALIEQWQPIFWPKAKTDLHGALTGSATLEGPSDHLHGDLTMHLDNAHYKAFDFSTELSGTWGPQGIKPMSLKGHFKTGGNFEFHGLLSDHQEAQGTLKLTDFNVRPLGESLTLPKPVDGKMNATLTLNGPLTRLAWSGHLDGGPLSYGGSVDTPLRLEEITMDMTLAPRENETTIEHLTVIEAQARTAEELIRFQSGSFIEFAGHDPARFKFGTDIRNLHLGLFTLFGGLDMEGTWQAKPESFAIVAKGHSHQLFINDYELAEGLVLIDYYKGVLKFPAPTLAPSLVTGAIDFHTAPQLHFTNFFISGDNRTGLELSGDIGPSLWDFQMVGHSLDLGILGELAGFPYPMSGTADVKVRGTGSHDHPHVEGSVDLSRGTAMGVAFRTGSASFIWQDTRISFTKLSLADPSRYTLEGAGIFPLMSKDKNKNQDHPIDFSIRLIDSNLGLLQSFMPEVKQAKGPVDGLLQIKGTLEEPSLHGSVHVTNGDVLGAHYFHQLRNANLSIDFDGENVNIRELRGRSGEGEFRGAGTITLAGFIPAKYDLKMDVVSSKGVDVEVPELAIPESPLAKRFHFLTTASRCDVRGHVTLKGPAESPVFSGTGIISNGHFTFPASRKKAPSPAVMEWFRRIIWDTDLRFQDGAWFENELVQAVVTGELKLKGPSDKLRVDGGLEINEGKISYLGLQFDVSEARYDMRSEVSGDTVINTPYVRGLAESQIQAVDTVSGIAGASGGTRMNVNDTITLTIDYARVDEIKPRLTSATNPTLTQDKILARITQTDAENLTPQEQNYLYQKQVLNLIDNSLTTPLAQNILKKTGIADRVRVQHVYDPNTATVQDLNSAAATQQQNSAVNLFANTKYTIEKDLSNRLSLGYGVRFVPSATTVDPELQQQQKLDLISDVQLSYHWFKNVYLKGDFDLPTSNPTIVPERKVTIEPRWRFGWWGNTNADKLPKKKESAQ